MRTRINHLVSIMFATIVVTASQLPAQANKKVLTMDDYARWRTVTSTQLSSDGMWMTYDYRKPEADDDAPDERNLQIRHLASSKVYQVRFGVSPTFSDDSKWVAYTIDIDRKEAKKLKAQKKPTQRQVQLLNLQTGDKVTWKNATSFSFSKGSKTLAILKPKTKGAEHAGHDLIVRDLNRNLDHHFGSVSSYQFNKPGTLLAYADPDRVGLCGHSFSGYGCAYIASRSKKFAAACAGAGVYDHVSDFNHLWGYSVDNKKGSGRNSHQYDIYGQGRMGTNPHDNFDLYRSQSPVAHVKGMTTPLLLMQGESDSTVAWIEAIGMYNAMRFNGKNVILLSYPGEGHGLSKRVNRIDFTKRVLETGPRLDGEGRSVS